MLCYRIYYIRTRSVFCVARSVSRPSFSNSIKQKLSPFIFDVLYTAKLGQCNLESTMNDIDIVDKIFEDRFGDEFQQFSSEQEVGSGTRYRRRTKVRKRSRLESPYQLYPPPSQRRKKRSSNFSRWKFYIICKDSNGYNERW